MKLTLIQDKKGFKMFKKCKICGEKFETQNTRYCTCSLNCSIKNARALNNTWKKNNVNKVREYRKPVVVSCRICGKEVPTTYSAGRNSHKYYHEKCVVKEALRAVLEGKGFNDRRVKRAYNIYGYSIKELREMLENERFLQ